MFSTAQHSRAVVVVLPGTSPTRPRPAGGTSTACGSAASWPRPTAGGCTAADLPGRWPRPEPAAARPAGRRAGRAAGRRAGAAGRAGRLRGAGDHRAGGATGCGWPCSCTCRWPTRPGWRPTWPPSWTTGSGATLRAARAVVVTSAGGRPRPGPARPGRRPGARGRARGGRGRAGRRHRRRVRLLCVASVTPRKGQDRLVDALAELTDRRWTLACVGPLRRAPGYVEALARPDRPARPRPTGSS